MYSPIDAELCIKFGCKRLIPVSVHHDGGKVIVEHACKGGGFDNNCDFKLEIELERDKRKG